MMWIWSGEGRMITLCCTSLYRDVCFTCANFAFSLREAAKIFWPRGAERHRPTCTPGLGGQAQVLRSFWRDGSLKFLMVEVLNAHPELY